MDEETRVQEIADGLYFVVRRRSGARPFDGAPTGDEVSDVWIEIDLPGDWRAAARMVPDVAGDPSVGEVRLYPADDWPGREPGTWRAEVVGSTAATDCTVPDDSTDVRLPDIGAGVPSDLRLPFRQVRNIARALQDIWDSADDITFGQWGPLFGQWGPLFGQSGPTDLERFIWSPQQSVEEAWSIEHYVRIALLYSGRREAGSRRPRADVAEAFGLTNEQARDAIWRCRTKHGLLTKAQREGLAGGRATAKCHRLAKKLEITTGGKSNG